MSEYWNISTSIPVGLQSLGLENLVKKTIVLLLPLAIMCIGPVSFPTDIELCFAKKNIWPIEVIVHRFRISFEIDDSWEQIFLSSSEPTKIGFIFGNIDYIGERLGSTNYNYNKILKPFEFVEKSLLSGKNPTFLTGTIFKKNTYNENFIKDLFTHNY